MRDFRIAAASIVSTAARVLRRIIGAPDYAAYLDHMRTSHPSAAPVSETDFRQRHLERRYNRPGSRCC